jgi:hypothetical protein
MERNIGKYTCIIGKWLNYYRKIVTCAIKKAITPATHNHFRAFLHRYARCFDRLLIFLIFHLQLSSEHETNFFQITC